MHAWFSDLPLFYVVIQQADNLTLLMSHHKKDLSLTSILNYFDPKSVVR